MQREPMVYGAVGTVFGFVLGYMAANWDGGAAPRPVAPGQPTTQAVQSPAAGAAGQRPAGGVDPDELRALESLAVREKTNAQVRVNLGNLLMDAHEYAGAVRWYREAIALEPGQLDVVVDLGACLVEGGQALEGLAEFDRALKQDPGHKNALYNRGVALVKLGRAAEAAATWEDLLKRYPNDGRFAHLREDIGRLRVPQGAGS